MPQTTKRNNNVTAKPQHKLADQPDSLKGTLLSVMIIGAFLAISWAGVFALFLIRS